MFRSTTTKIEKKKNLKSIVLHLIKNIIIINNIKTQQLQKNNLSPNLNI